MLRKLHDRHDSSLATAAALMLATWLASAAYAPPANASVIDRPFFNAQSLVIVIDYLEATDSLTSFGLDTATDINTRQSRNVSRFLVVSNAPFDMFAQASNLTRTGDFTALDYENIGFRALINRSGGSGTGAWGSAAQNPAVGGSGIDSNLNDLGDMSAGPTKLFDGGRRTARNVGTLLEQAVSFNIRYALSGSPDSSLNNAYDFSMGVGTIGADVTYTVYTP